MTPSVYRDFFKGDPEAVAYFADIALHEDFTPKEIIDRAFPELKDPHQAKKWLNSL